MWNHARKEGCWTEFRNLPNVYLPIVSYQGVRMHNFLDFYTMYELYECVTVPFQK